MTEHVSGARSSSLMLLPYPPSPPRAKNLTTSSVVPELGYLRNKENSNMKGWEPHHIISMMATSFSSQYSNKISRVKHKLHIQESITKILRIYTALSPRTVLKDSHF